MKQIKPEIVGYQRVLNSGNLSPLLLSKDDMVFLSKQKTPFVCTHSKGMPKFRPVYKKEIK